MSGIGSTLSIAKTAIAAQQYGLNVTGQNIANVNNPDYSVQNAQQKSMKPALYGGFLFGTGVDTYQIRQSVDQLLEQRLTNEQSNQASFDEQESYMRILEGFFDETSDASIRSVLTEFWNSWQDLSDNPLGSSERVTIYENGIKLASRFEAAVIDMDGLVDDITSDISAAVTRINSLTSKIAELNNEIVGVEINRSANDQRDQRNMLMDELGDLIDIETFEKPNGAIIVNAANGYTIINGVDTYELSMQDKEVAWRSSLSGDLDISDRITSGRLGGLLQMRDEIIPKYRAEIDALSREMIWALNYQHSQGVGLEYFKDSIIGDYATDESGWLANFEFGDKIDYSKDFTLWTEDKTFAETQYTKTNIDMGVSQAAISNWTGTAPGTIQSIYRLTVVDEAVLGDRIVTESDGDGLGIMHGSTGSVATTLGPAIADQILTIYGGSLGTEIIDISDAGGDAKRSAASIAELMNNAAGVEASASETSASFNISGILNAQDGDEIQFSLYVDGVTQQASFVRDSSTGTMQEQFEDELIAATEAINAINGDSDLFANGLTISSDMGRTLGVEAFEVVDNAGVRLDAFTNFDQGDIVTFTVQSSVAPITDVQVSVDLTGVDITDQAEVSLAFSNAMTSALAGEPFTVEHDPATNSVILRTTDRSDIILTNAANDTGNNASVDLTTLAGTDANAGNTIDFSNAANTDTFVATVSAADTLTFFVPGISTSTLDISGVVNAQDGDEIQFSLNVDGVVQQETFFRDSSIGTLQAQFETALLSVTAAINATNGDSDLSAGGLVINSSAGRNIGVQGFQIVDNTGVMLDAFTNFNAADTVTFTIESSIAPISTTNVSVDLTGVNIADQADLASTFNTALTAQLAGTPFTSEYVVATDSVILRSTNGSDVILRNAANDTGNDASIDLTTLAGTDANAGNTIDFSNPANSDTFVATIGAGDTLTLLTTAASSSTATIAEVTAGAGDQSAVVTGTVTVLMDPGMTIASSVSGAGSGGLFDDNYGKTGSSIITLGGAGGFSNFTSGETITFDVDGTTVTFLVPAGTNDLQLATALETQISNDFIADGVDGNYEVIRTGASISIIKDLSFDEPIEITNFSESVTDDATLAVSTGTGTGSNQPENELLESGNTYRDFATSTLYNDEGIILWEKLNNYGLKTGETGLVTVEDEGNVSIMEGGVPTLSFDISAGSLVAGNTLTINTDTLGRPDPLNFTISGQANSINEIYKFRVVSGGKVGELPATGVEPLVIEWRNSVNVGTFTIEGHDPPYTPLAPVEARVDGMIVNFFDGTLFTDDVFTITTGDTGFPISSTSSGLATGESASDWHWTIDSFADQFTKTAAGMKATTTLDNRLKFSTSDQYHVINNIEYSESNGFSEDNVSILVKDQTALDFSTADLRFVRAGGNWGVMGDPTGGLLALIPAGGDDDGFGVDFTGNGLADIEIKFNTQVLGDGYVEFDFQAHGFENLGFAFSDDSALSSGLLAAAGINNFFEGYDSMTMEVNDKLSSTKFVTAATINSETGEISLGDNTNALAMSDVQHQSRTLKLWEYQRGSEAQSSNTNATLDDYYNQMIGSMGIKSRTIKNSKSFADTMVNNIRAQRDSISAVSLDEEMIKLMKYQHAFSAASKLLTVSDEMLNTLIAMR